MIRLGDTDWQVLRASGHTPGHPWLWHADEGVLICGDALSDYHVDRVWAALDGPDVASLALASIEMTTRGFAKTGAEETVSA